jgi:hypothetical protein
LSEIDPYFRVYRSVASRLDLLPAEKLLFHLIASLCHNENLCCTASNEYLAEWLGLKPRYVRDILKGLIEKGLISNPTPFGNHHRQLFVALQAHDKTSSERDSDTNVAPETHDSWHCDAALRGTVGPHILKREERINKRETKGLTPSFQSSEIPDIETFCKNYEPPAGSQSWDLSGWNNVYRFVETFGHNAVLAEVSRRYLLKKGESTADTNEARRKAFETVAGYQPPGK